MIASAEGFIPQSKRYGRFMAGDSLKNYVRLRRGEFSYNRGNSKLYPQGCVYRLEEWDEAAVPNVYISFALDDSALDPGFVAQFFEAGGLNRQLARVITSTARSNGLLNISGDDFFACEIPVPSLDEQRKIAAVLTSVDEAIAATQMVLDQTMLVKQGLLQTLMTRGLGHTRFKKTEIGEIPEAWAIRRLGEVASVERGKFTARPRNDPRYYGGEIPFVQTGDVTAAQVQLISHSQTLNEEGLAVSRLFPTGTILITIAANIGDVAEATYPVAFPDSVVGIQAGPDVDTRWLLYMLGTRRRQLNNAATQNAQKNINLQTLRPLPIPLPPLAEQREIARRLDATARSLSESEALLGSLDQLKRGLMQDLLTGRVRVQPD